jgi:Abnormal spindle-like microcephaly-assoc'd, ASPM-SPD-2-Hydin
MLRASKQPPHAHCMRARPMRIASSFVIVVALVAALGIACADAAGRICMSADTLSFGQQMVGSSTLASVTVSNCGTDAWSFTDVSAHSATNPGFRIDSTCTTGLTLAAGAACTIDVHFEPTAPGQASGALWLHNTTSTPDQLLTFYARAIDVQAGTATLQFVPAIADFGSRDVGSESQALVVTLRNVGASPLVPSALVLNGLDPYDFRGASSAGDCGIGRAIAAGGSCTLSLYFAPRDVGPRQATLVVDAPQLASLAFFTLTGQGQALPSDPATIDVIEFSNARDGQYFITADPHEITLLDDGGLGADWSRTGASFHAWPPDATPLGALPVCRFFGTPGIGPNSHFYTAYDNECAIVRKDPHWMEEGVTFRARLPSQGACEAADVTVYRLWKAGATVTASRHRYVVDRALAEKMQGDGWVLEGAVFCGPAS